jgi:hypothetical protein
MSTVVPSAIDADILAAKKDAADKEFTDAVKVRFLEIADDAGVVADGKVSPKLLADAVFDVVKTKRVVNIEPDDDDRRDPAKSSHKEELAEIIFPRIPSGSAADRNSLENAIREKCLTAVWDMVSTSVERGPVQQRLRPFNLVLIRGVVFRGSKTVKDGVFVSTHEDIIRRELIGKRVKRARSQLEALADEFQMVVDRVPELRGVLESDIEQFMVEVTAKLPVPTLAPGDSGGRKALGK